MSEFINLSKYTKIEKIGQGAFGKVLKVKENDTENIFAAKISLEKINKEDTTLILDLKREVSILSQLNHPSVLKFIGYSPIDFKGKNRPVIITDFSSNGSLGEIIELERKFLRPKLWTDTKKLINLYGIASAMSYLHSHNIIHRDLKPANILEDDNFFPKIADFGLSKIYHQNKTTESTIGFKGTPLYTSPEIWANNEYTKSGDVYSFGIIVYELLTLDEPFEDYLDLTHISKAVLNGERPEINYPLPDCYENLITRCWSQDPKKRPTFQGIVKELRMNKEFILDTIDEGEYYNYIDLIDDKGNSFDRDKKHRPIIYTKSNQEQKNKNHSDKSKKSISEENIKTSVKIFNNLSLDKQYSIICNIEEKNDIILDIKNILTYLLGFKFEERERYFIIKSKEENKSIKDIFEEPVKIFLSSSCIDMINEKQEGLKELSKYINNFNKIIIELKYPNSNFVQKYKEVYYLKKAYKTKIFINIFINGLNKTDMELQDYNIDTIQIGPDIKEISGGELSFKKIGNRIYEGGSFNNCSLKKIIIHSSLIRIGENAFHKCRSLKQIKIPSSVTSIEEGAFRESLSLEEISIPSSITSIEPFTFEKCQSLTHISLPSSVTSIGSSAFKGCSSLEQIKIPCSITEIGESSFKECSFLALITFETPFSLKSIGNYAFSKCSLLKQIIIPSSVNSIGNFAFSNCKSLKKITIPSSVETIGNSTFSDCSSLTQISFEIPSSVTSIGNNVFNGCSSLEQISILSSVTEIGDKAFFGCSSLTQISIPSSVTSIGVSAFSGCSSLRQVSFEIPSSTTSIGDSAFSLCSSLIQILIPSSVNSIGVSAFSECSSLEQVSFETPSSITLFDKNSFSKCKSLTQISIPSSVTSIGNNAFSECSSLTQILIPSSLKKIENYAFDGCSSLAQISIPSSVKEIGEHAFIRCSSLTQMLLKIPLSSKTSFDDCSTLKQISIPSSMIETSKNVPDDCIAIQNSDNHKKKVEENTDNYIHEI